MQTSTAHVAARPTQTYWDRRFAVCAALAAAVDLLTKQLAVSMLGEREIAIGERLGLVLVWNTGGPGGYSLGPTLSLLNIVMTAIAVMIMSMIAADLGRVHRLGAIALGIVTGGAVGNLASMVAGPAGVADFLAIHLTDRSIVFNVADIALWSGAMMLIPVVILLLRAIRTERKNKSRGTIAAV
jgi:lipoprotein signal peptidase